MRAVLEAAGVKDVLAKIIGTTNPHNVLGATVDALKQLEDARMVAARRGVPVDHVASQTSDKMRQQREHAAAETN